MIPFDVEGPVLAEVFVVFADGDGIRLSGPCGAARWHLEVPAGDDPMVVTREVVTRVLGAPRLLHSTSWRRDKGAVVLSFVVVVDAAALVGMADAPVQRAELARGGRDSAPTAIAGLQVLEHALRHLAWLLSDDEVVAAELDEHWRRHLAHYVPEPFRALA